MASSGVKALAFDVFGTVVDYRSTIIREGERLQQVKGINVDWGQFADAWRGRYRPNMDRVGRQELPWMNLDALHRLALEEVMREFGIANLTEAEKVHLNRVWHRLQPWPDSIVGLTRLRKQFVTATLSNGNVALLVNMAKYSGLPWDCILSAELVQAYKPDPKVYQMAVDLLGFQPEQVMMVAAHQGDLRAAQAIGLKAAFVPRPLEFGLHSRPDLTPDPTFDMLAIDLVDLARQLGV
ncbi:MAG: haloacid dehalogenase type II [Ktedonobacteraceae bacterium]